MASTSVTVACREWSCCSLHLLPDWLNQKCTRSKSTYTRSAQPVPFRSARKSRLGSKSTLEARRIRHRDALAEAAVAQVGPVVDPAVMNQDDVIQAVAGHVGQANSSRRIVEKHIRELIEVVLARDVLAAAQSPFRPDIRTRGNARPRVISASDRPSPVRSTSRTLGSCQVEAGEDSYGLNVCQVPSDVVSKNPGSGPACTSRSTWPSPPMSPNPTPG